MTDRPLLTMCLIAKDEAHNIERCFSSWWDDVDQVVLIDTGSTDNTIATAKRFAAKRKQSGKLKIAGFKWCDDFAAARQAADDLATGEWVTWCDLDDTIVGMDKLRQYAANAAPSVAAFFLHYRYAIDSDGNTISELWRERVVRNDGTKWQGRLHEHKTFTPPQEVVRVGQDDADWIHHRDHENERTGERNLRILEQWDRDEPDNARILQSLGMEYMGLERHQDASDTFRRYLALGQDTPDRRAQACRHMCIMLMIQGRVEEAFQAALASLADTALWPDTYLTLAEACQTVGKPQEGLLWARQALTLGVPDTLLIINPLQYTAHPRALAAICLAQMGNMADAVREAEDALRIAPSYQLITQHLPGWRAELRKQNASAAFAACADTLVETGELLKAAELLNVAPWYVAERAELIDKRAQILAEVARRQDEDAPLPEDAEADQLVELLAAAA